MNATQKRLRKIIGQLEGVGRMIENEKPCTDVIIQLKAVHAATASALEHYSKDAICQCVENEFSTEADKKKLQKLLQTLIRQ
jgi:DNA-binding FrmR family transcriptional regulator